jgi:long-chain acyl-CoA synthetase
MAPRIRKEVHYGDRVVDCYEERHASVQALVAAAVASAGDRVAVEDGELLLTYDALESRVARLAGAFRARGVASGDRVAIILDNRAEFVITLLACVRLNAIAVPMGTRLRGPEIAFICRDSEPRLVIHEAALAGQLPGDAAMPGLARVAVAGDPAAADSFERLMAEAEPVDPAPVAEDDPFCIMYTSGTTGRPKGAVITHLGVVHSCMHWVERLGLTEGISTLLVIPVSHVSGLAGVLMPLLHLGGRIIMMRTFKAAALVDIMAAKRVEHALLVPAMYNLCLRDEAILEADLGAWRWAVYGGAPMPEPTIRRFAEILPRLHMCNAYGATETSSPVTIMAPGKGLERSDSIGRTVACGDVRVMDEAGREVPPGQSGELFIAGPMVVPGYWRNEEATRAGFASGYWRSGDIGSIDDEGYVRIFDRKRDMIIRGGYKVFPAEVENVLCDHPGVVEAAVIGAPDEVLGEIVVAFVQSAADGVEADALTRFCAERMADYKVPDRLRIRTEPLPRNANGKLQKDELRREIPDLARAPS